MRYLHLSPLIAQHGLSSVCILVRNWTGLEFYGTLMTQKNPNRIRTTFVDRL